MCDIWKDPTRREISGEEFGRYLLDFEKLSVQWVVFSGGEPLMHSDLFRFCRLLRERRIRTTILTTGILLERDAPRIARDVDDLIVSLDGPPALHDRIRRVPHAFDRLAHGIEAIQSENPHFPVSSRTTVQRENFRALRETARTARSIGLRSISFLAADLTSTAFNRPGGWAPARQSQIAVPADELPALDAEIEALVEEWRDDPFVVESPDKLRRIARHYRAYHGLCEPEPPQCNAPWVSAVIEADGAVRPCFFHRPIGHAASAGLTGALNSPPAQTFRSELNVQTNPICRRCVCSLHWNGA